MQLQAGSLAPPLTGARDVGGKTVTLEVAAGTHVLLVFLRYASCPMCLLHVRELVRRYAALRQAGVRHFYVSNLPLRRTAATLNAILERAGVLMARGAVPN